MDLLILRQCINEWYLSPTPHPSPQQAILRRHLLDPVDYFDPLFVHILRRDRKIYQVTLDLLYKASQKMRLVRIEHSIHLLRHHLTKAAELLLPALLL